MHENKDYTKCSSCEMSAFDTPLYRTTEFGNPNPDFMCLQCIEANGGSKRYPIISDLQIEAIERLFAAISFYEK